ncbi:aldo/keto reductase [Schleiferilactobacillus harbinensis]|uniref:aldo/keto reductase n=1 Tax=Schleiferilactobacillus harbinensis TaxID=304207 RepID=UPI001CC2DAF5|nr:aldo/keto reductase [Schleiferilactobacillus harbinensis]
MGKIKAQSLTDTYTLNNGVHIPVIGFGTWQAKPDDAYTAVKAALAIGYRHIDTAAVYGNEEAVGKAIKDSGVPRQDIFVTTKLWNEQRLNYDDVLHAQFDSLQRLGLDYIDLYLVHCAEIANHHQEWQKLNATTWRAMEYLYTHGAARAIGVSNYMVRHLKELAKTQEVVPAVNQNYLNPFDRQEELVAYDTTNNILNEAYSPLVTGELLNNEIVTAIAKKHNRSAAQILIRWSLEEGFLPLPKSIHPDYIAANAQVFDFELDADNHEQIATLQGKGPMNDDPRTVDFTNFIPWED